MEDPRPAMVHSTPRQRISSLIGALLGARDQAERDRVLLGAVFHLGAGEAASLWHPVADPGSGSPRWRPVLERGPATLLPRRDAVAAGLEEDLPFALPHGGRILRAMGPRHPLVLALGGGDPDEEAVEALEALLVLQQHLDASEAGFSAPLDVLQDLLPHTFPDDPEAGDEGDPGSEDEAA